MDYYTNRPGMCLLFKVRMGLRREKLNRSRKVIVHHAHMLLMHLLAHWINCHQMEQNSAERRLYWDTNITQWAQKKKS